MWRFPGITSSWYEAEYTKKRTMEVGVQGIEGRSQQEGGGTGENKDRV